MPNNPWDMEISQTLRNINIPMRTKCVVCKRVKQNDQYSTKQLNDLRFRVAKYGQDNAVPKEGLIRCRECTGVQNLDMKCSICLDVKPLEGFSLAQRSRKDTACQEELDETHPDDRKATTGHDATRAYNHDEEIDDDRSTTDASEIWEWNRQTGNYYTGHRFPSSASSAGSEIYTASIAASHRPSEASADALTRTNLAKLSLHGTGSTNNPRSPSENGSGFSASDSEGGVPLPKSAGLKHGSETGENIKPDPVKNNGVPFRGWDTWGRNHQQYRAPSTPKASTQSTTTFISDAASESDSHPSMEFPYRGRPPVRSKKDDSNRNFARVRPQNKPLRRFIDDERPQPNPTPSKTRIHVGVMDDVDSDDD